MLTEPELYIFIERLDAFTAQLSRAERQFLTTILLRALTGSVAEVVTPRGHPDSELHARLTCALWEAERGGGSISLNPLPLPAQPNEPLVAGE
jgi:hypothetical protein